MKTIAFFDFDGTITYKDSLWQFIFYTLSPLKICIGLFCLSPVFCLHFAHLISIERMKRIMVYWFFSGIKEDKFERMSVDFCLKKLPSIVRPEALSKLEWHKLQGHRVVIVSANFEEILKEWCCRNSCALIATSLDYSEGKLTGTFSESHCHGAEKVRRIRATFDLSSFSEIYAYGDSEGDKEMLALAHFPFLKRFY